MAGDALLQVGATVTEWSRTDYTAIVALKRIEFVFLLSKTHVDIVNISEFAN